MSDRGLKPRCKQKLLRVGEDKIARWLPSLSKPVLGVCLKIFIDVLAGVTGLSIFKKLYVFEFLCPGLINL